MLYCDSPTVTRDYELKQVLLLLLLRYLLLWGLDLY